MKRIYTAIIGVFVSISVLGALAGGVMAIDPLKAGCAAKPDSEICAQTKSSGADIPTTIQNIIQLLLFVLGVICVIVIIVAGIQYAVAAGDSNQITRAKNSILYAIVGLVIALLAYAIVGFVVQQFR